MATDIEHRGGAKELVFGLLWIVGACWICYAWFGNPLDELALIRHAQVVPGLLIDSWEDYKSKVVFPMAVSLRREGMRADNSRTSSETFNSPIQSK